MFYKTMTALLFFTYSLHAMQTEVPSTEVDTEMRLNKAAHGIWDILERFTNGEKVPNQEVLMTNQEYERAYQEFLKRHKRS